MMKNGQHKLGFLLLMALMAGTAFWILQGQSIHALIQAFSALSPLYLFLGFALMLLFVGCEGLGSWLILRYLGHFVSYGRCLGYSLVGFYFSSITPSSTGGQPAQVYTMAKDGIPPAHGTLNMLLLSTCYQASTLIYALAVWLFLPQIRGAMTGAWGWLLLLGCGVMVALTASMGFLMFLPPMTRSLLSGVLHLLQKLRIVRDTTALEDKLYNIQTEYAQGASCIRKNPGLMVGLLLVSLVQLTALFGVPYLVYLGFGLAGHSVAELIGMQALLSLAVGCLPLPGAVGASEGVFLHAFTLFFGGALVTPAMLVARGISFYGFLVIAGCVTLVVLSRKRKKCVQPC